MHPDWQAFITSAGGTAQADGRLAFPEPAAALSAAGSGILADLSHFGLVRFSGADAQAFLQGQLSCDVAAIADGGTAFGSYCTPKGRMLATFLLWREGEAYSMLLSRSIAPAIAKRLKMFVMRSKVVTEDLSDATVLLGLGGDKAAAALATLSGAGLPAAGRLARAAGIGAVVALADGRFLLACDDAQAAVGAWNSLGGQLVPAGGAAWDWMDIRSGTPMLTAPVQEQFVPQMANLELIGGVSFKKGCYPGQEIVARTQYLGKVKRRMFRARVSEAAQAGDELFSDDTNGQSNGMVLSAQPAPGGAWEALVVVQLASKETSRVRLRSPAGPVLEFIDLPYQVA
jgi:folate-binding protein YgfZ